MAVGAKGIIRDNLESKVFDNLTFHGVGLIKVRGGKRANTELCKYRDANGDRFIVEGHEGNAGFIHGTGKWKGIPGGFTARRFTQGKPIVPDTFQGCAKLTGWKEFGMSEKTRWQTFFDAHASVYDENAFTKNTVPEVDFLLEELRLAPGCSILDVGCGTGRHSIELAKRGYAVTGLDLSSEMLARAASAAKNADIHVEWIHADATKFSFPRRFDAAICLCEGAFGLLGPGDDPIDQPLSILRNLSRSLKPQAKAVFTVLNAAAMLRKYQNKDVAEGRFDPLTMVESSEYPPREGLSAVAVRERGFVATELRLLFRLAGMSVVNVWGGTAGNWGRRTLDLDEIEIMIVARKIAEPSAAGDA